ADLAGRDVGVVRTGQVAGLGRAQEAESVGQDLQHAVGGDAFAVAGQHLQHGEDDVLLAGAGDALGDVQLLGDVEQLLRRHPLEVAQRVAREALRDLRVGPRDEGLVAAVVAGQAVAVAVAVALVAEAVAPVAAAAFLVAATLRVVATLAVATLAVATLAVAGLAVAGLPIARCVVAARRVVATRFATVARRALAFGLPFAGCAGAALVVLGRRGGGLGLHRGGLGLRGGGSCGSRLGRRRAGVVGGGRLGLAGRRSVGLAGARLAHALFGGVAGVGGVIGQAGIPR